MVSFHKCPRCASPLIHQDRFCPECGLDLAQAAAKLDSYIAVQHTTPAASRPAPPKDSQLRATWIRFNKWEWSGCVWIIVALVLVSQFGKSCSGPAYPFDQSFQEDVEVRAELTSEARDAHLDDPCVQDAMAHVPHEYSRCNPSRALQEPLYEPYDSVSPDAVTPAPVRCAAGCTSHIAGCDIKGNISFDTGEKIYHLPGQEYYASTIIDPAYGERWFCTEPEARANGFRRSYK